MSIIPLIVNSLVALKATPFGMLIPNRHQASVSASYRYGFQGQEQDNEIKGKGNSINYKYRVHDPRLGRFLSVDPKALEMAWMSPYIFAANNPIRFLEIEGGSPGEPLKKVNNAANSSAKKAWYDSFNKDNNEVYEVGFIVVERKREINVGKTTIFRSEVYVKNYKISEYSSKIKLDQTIDEGETIIGELHTHRYGESQGFIEGVTFSPKDISILRNHIKKDYVSIVESGNKRFGLVIVDETKAKEFFDSNTRSNIRKIYNKAFLNSTKKDSQGRALDAVKAVITKNSGIEFYETTDDEKQEWKKN